MKKRLDVLLVERGLFPSREKAKAVIMAGQVYVDCQKADKPGMDVEEAAALEVRGETLRYVSRGGLKLEKAMRVFPVVLEGKTCMDIGASTGGFTDCMLQNGAEKVYAVDVGYGQLAWKLRTDGRVVNLERTNIRYVTREQVPDPIDFASVDVSFISLMWRCWKTLSATRRRTVFRWPGSTFRRSRGRRATSNTSCTSAGRRGAPSRNVRRSRRWWSVPTRRLTESLEGMWCGWSRKPY